MLPPLLLPQTILRGQAKLTGPHSISYGLPGRVDVGGTATAKDIIIATGAPLLLSALSPQMCLSKPCCFWPACNSK